MAGVSKEHKRKIKLARSMMTQEEVRKGVSIFRSAQWRFKSLMGHIKGNKNMRIKFSKKS